MKLKKISVLLVAALLCICMALPVCAAGTQNAVVSLELDGERNTAADAAPVLGGFCGAAITVGEKDIVVTALGRMYFTGANAYHSCLIVNATDNSLLGNPLTVQNYEDSVDGTFEYYYMEENEYVTLKAGQTYYLCSDFYGPTDRFYDSSAVVSTEDLSFVGYVELNVADGSWIYYEAPGINYMPMDLQYHIAGEEPVPAETEPEITEPETTEPEVTEAPDTEPQPTVPAEVPEVQKNTDWLTWVLGGLVVVLAAVLVIVLVTKKKK